MYAVFIYLIQSKFSIQTFGNYNTFMHKAWYKKKHKSYNYTHQCTMLFTVHRCTYRTLLVCTKQLNINNVKLYTIARSVYTWTDELILKSKVYKSRFRVNRRPSTHLHSLNCTHALLELFNTYKIGRFKDIRTIENSCQIKRAWNSQFYLMCRWGDIIIRRIRNLQACYKKLTLNLYRKNVLNILDK